MYFDSHAHYDDRKFNNDRGALLAELPDRGIVGVINAGACLISSRASVSLAEKYPYVYAAVGVHPHEAKGVDGLEKSMEKSVEKSMEKSIEKSIEKSMEKELEELCACEKVVALGEMGLDFHYDNSPRDVQRLCFVKQLGLAKRLDLPVIIHSREAAQETFNIIKESGVRKGGLHCYSGHLPMALEYVKMGFYIGLGGVVTYKNAEKTREVAAGVPLERLLIETDAPYLPPVPFRGKRNDSTMLPLVVEAIAAARGISADEVALATTENAKKLFGL